MKYTAFLLSLLVAQAIYAATPYDDAIRQEDAKNAAQARHAAESRIVFQTVFSEHFTRSSQVTARIVSTNAQQIAGMALVIDPAYVAAGPASRDYLKNVKNSDYQPFKETFTVDLGEEEGERTVWVGLLLHNGVKQWQRHRVTVDRTPPAAVVTHPATLRTSQPAIDLTAFAPEELASISFDFKNTEGQARKESAGILERVIDRAARKTSKTVFRCEDLPMANGTNWITLHLRDLAGNEASQRIPIVFDLSDDTTPPLIEVHWPTEQDEVYQNSFRLRGRTDDPTAKLEVRDSKGEVFTGVIQRDGHFWIPKIPLSSEFSEFTISAIDAAGNVEAKRLLVKRSPVTVTMNPPGEVRFGSRPTISGTISHTGYTVWVNGAEAAMTDKNWEAKRVPLNTDGGSVVLQYVAIPNTANGGKGYGSPRKPTLLDMGNPKLRPEDVKP